MKSWKSTIFASLLLAGFAFGASNSAEKSYQAYTDVPVPQLKWQPPKFAEFSLSNGISGLVVEDNEVPLVNFYILLPAQPDPEGKDGLGGMATWVLRNGGTTKINADSLNELIEFKAGGLYINAGDEYVSIWGNCLAEDLPLFISLTSDLLKNPAYPQEKIDLNKATTIESIRRKNDEPRGIARRELYKILYAGHPWGMEETEASISGITRDDLVAYHKSFVRSDGVVIGFSGAIDTKRAKKLAGDHFGWLKKGKGMLARLPDIKAEPRPGVYYAYKDINQAFISVGHLSVKYADPRRHAAEIMNYVLGGGGFQSILMKRIRVDAGLSYGVGTAISLPHDVTGSFRGSTSTRLDQSGRTLALLEETIAKFAESGPTEEEFNTAKSAFVNSIVWRTESASDVLSETVYLKWKGLPLYTPQKDLTAYQNLTWSDVVKAAKELLHPDKMVVVVVGNREKMDRSLEDFGSVTAIDLNAVK